MSETGLKRLAIWALILAAAGIAFWTSFRNSVDMASIAQTDANGILRVKVLNAPDASVDAPLLLKIEYAHAEFRGSDGKPIALPFPQPFTAVLVDGKNRLVARLGKPDAQGNVPAIENFPRDEKYFWVGFPKITTDGKPVSLLIRNPFYGK